MMEHQLDVGMKEARTDNLAVRLNATERGMLLWLANRLQRSQSDTVRLVVREAVQALMLCERAEGSSVPGPGVKKRGEVRK